MTEPQASEQPDRDGEQHSEQATRSLPPPIQAERVLRIRCPHCGNIE